MERVDISNDALTELQKRASNEAQYIEKALKAKGHDINHIDIEMERIEDLDESGDYDEFHKLLTDWKKRDYEKAQVKKEA